eukprot:c48465_g1_i1 orf=3-218(-)
MPSSSQISPYIPVEQGKPTPRTLDSPPPPQECCFTCSNKCNQCQNNTSSMDPDFDTFHGPSDSKLYNVTENH